ncbi:Calcium channel yvc1, variant 2 [Umbelopsis sp. WA50703]
MARLRNGFFDPAKIHVPKYANAIETFITILFLVLYTVVINDERSHVPTVLEWVMYIFVLGDVLDDIRDIYNTGMFHYYSFWACTNTLTHLVFIASFVLRMAAFSSTGSEKDMLNNTSLDVLSVVSILLWFRVLSVVCNTWRYFGSYTIIVQSMLSDALMFFFLLIWVIFGFFQAFIALRTENTAEDNDFSEIASLLMRGYLMAPDFDKAQVFHAEIGEPLFYAYIFLVSVVLQSFLTSVFSDSFSKISQDAKAQYLSNFAYRVITAVDSRSALPPPFNLVEILFLGLPYLIMSKKSYEKLRYYFLAVLFCIPLLVVTFHEKMLLQLDNARPDDSLSDDEGNMNEEQDFTTADDDHVKGLKDIVGKEALEKVVNSAALSLKSGQVDPASNSGNELLHSDIKRVVRMLETINERLQRLESNAQSTS